MIKGITFDLEGTVVDLEYLHQQAHLAVCRSVNLNYSVEDAAQKIAHFIGGPDEAVMQDIQAISGTSSSWQQLLEMDRRIYEKELASAQIQPREGFNRVLGEIKRLGLPVSIGSLTSTKDAIIILERSGLKYLFDRDKIVLKEHVQKLKPAPDVYLETARSMGISPAEQLVFEDSPNGVRAAISAGSKAIGIPVYDYPASLKKLREAGVSNIFQSWNDVDIKRIIRELSD